MLKEHLCQIGFTDSESKVYLELLRLGPQAVSIIAKRTGLNRTTTYSILKSLEKKGVVSSYKNSTMHFFVASDPNSLIGYLDRKCQTFDYYRSELLSIIPKFRILTEKYTFKKPIVAFFDGVEGVKHVMYDALTGKSDFRAYIPIQKWFESGMKDFLIQYKNFLTSDDGLSLKAIVPDTAEVRNFFRGKKITNVSYVKDASFQNLFEDGVNIYGDKVSVINLDKGSEYGVVIENKQFANMNKVVFDIVFQQ
ncbi:helix-turn-helix domain-containing protein, partial [Candidatus Peregrinibacteria bacterium]|nr:helix-turn-helix domain-containing protein [Candidatus Peregrinibacteria bacterium]